MMRKWAPVWHSHATNRLHVGCLRQSKSEAKTAGKRTSSPGYVFIGVLKVTGEQEGKRYGHDPR